MTGTPNDLPTFGSGWGKAPHGRGSHGHGSHGFFGKGTGGSKGTGDSKDDCGTKGGTKGGSKGTGGSKGGWGHGGTGGSKGSGGSKGGWGSKGASGGTKGGTGHGGTAACASSTSSYHNGGVEGHSFDHYYDDVLSCDYDPPLNDGDHPNLCGTHGGSGGSKGGTGGSKGATGGTHGGTGGTQGGTGGTHGGTGGTHGGTGGTQGGTGGTGGDTGGTQGGGGSCGTDTPPDTTPDDNCEWPGEIPVEGTAIAVVEFNSDDDHEYDAWVRIDIGDVENPGDPNSYLDAVNQFYADQGIPFDAYTEVKKLVFEDQNGKVVQSLYRAEDGTFTEEDPNAADDAEGASADDSGHDLLMPMSEEELAEYDQPDDEASEDDTQPCFA